MPLPPTSEKKQTWLWITIGLGFVIILVLLGPVLMPFVAGAILAYALNPGVDRLASHRIGKHPFPRWLAVTLILLAVVAAVLALVLVVLPILQKEIPLLQEKIPQLLTRLNQTVSPWLQRYGIHVRLDSLGLQKFLSQQIASGSDGSLGTLLASAKVGGIRLLGWLGNLLLIPVVLFYLLLDWHSLVAHAQNTVPRRWAAKTVQLAQEVNILLAQYLRGQAAVMLALAIYYSAGLAIAGFDIALPVGILTGLLVFIPYLGFGLGLVLAIIAALLQFDGLYGLIAVALVYGIGQVLESFILTPRLVGERIGLHPLAVIFALLAFGQLFGFVGVLLALPASAIMSVAFDHLRTNYLKSSFYTQP